MTHTKKRLLAMLLAVVLMFSSLPFSVSADEVSSELPTESIVESQLGESQAEEILELLFGKTEEGRKSRV